MDSFCIIPFLYQVLCSRSTKFNFHVFMIPMRKVLEDLLECLNADFKNLFQVDFGILW